MNLQIKDLCTLLQVFDLAVSVAFYRDILGFEIVDSDQDEDGWDWVWLRRNDVNLMLNAAYEPGTRPSSPDAARVRSHADTSLYFSCPDVDEAYQHFLALGLDVKEPKVAHYGMKQLSVTDPDGYHLCFQWPAD